jgi:LytS/YehU family sensor histidine kinase
MVRLPLPDGVSVPVVLFAKSARWFAIGALGYAFYVLRRQAAEAAAQAHESDLQRVRIDRQMTEARLQYLRAYIEPHFLFNTLANVHRLYRTEPERGRAMLAHFIAYLRAVLPQMRQGDTTLKQDIELARAYLGVLQVRMGERLSVSFDVPDDIAALPFPPLALATLTENAIKHGLNPMPEGGAIEINARLRNGQLVVQVADTGAGFRGESGTGSGLANLRARLAALYGDAARLDFEANRPRGLRATIAVPVRRAAEAA